MCLNKSALLKLIEISEENAIELLNRDSAALGTNADVWSQHRHVITQDLAYIRKIKQEVLDEEDP